MVSNKQSKGQKLRTRQIIIEKLKKRFSTYGYNQIRTPTFEAYDLFTQTNGLVNQKEMIKTIDPTGEVLVLRPDITIPVTRHVVKNKENMNDELRFFYVLNVFRNATPSITSKNKEKTQAGIECFGNDSITVDAEVVALAIHILKDLGFDAFKIELGHVKFLKELMKELPISET